MFSELLQHPFRTLLSGAVLAASLLWTYQASAVQYESEIDITNEQDLYDLESEGDISEETLETLLELFQSGVDLNTASLEDIYALPNLTYEDVNSIIEYRKAAGGIENPESLVSAGVLDEKLLLQIIPFITLSDIGKKGTKYISGDIKYAINAATGDDVAPPMMLRARVKGPYGLKAGVLMMTTRHNFGGIGAKGIYEAPNPYYIDSLGNTAKTILWADRPDYAFHIPKYYVEWKRPNLNLIVGTYRLGFGERLTLDNSSRSNPNGFYADDAYTRNMMLISGCKEAQGDSDFDTCNREEQVTPDYRWSHGFRGLAATGTLPLGDYQLISTVFISYESKSLYQYEMYDTEACSDPRIDSSECKAPAIYIGKSDGKLKYSYVTFQNMYRELAGGANATLKIGHQGRIGITGYGAKSTFRKFDSYELDFQEWSRIPYGGPYGAIGVDGAYFIGKFGLFGEVARSFDSMGREGGGFGFVQRTVFTPIKKQELELTLRYYDRDFANPYTRATAAADEYEGQRARNEAGARLRYHGRLPDWTLSGQVDFWFWPQDGLMLEKIDGEYKEVKDASMSQGTSHLQLKVRAEFTGFDLFQPWIAFDYRNRDLGYNYDSYRNASGNEVGACYDTQSTLTEGNLLHKCRGSFYRPAVGVKIKPLRTLSFDLRYQHAFVNDPHYINSLRQDVIFAITGIYKPIPEVNIKARFRYLSEDIKESDRYETSLLAYLQVAYTLQKKYTFQLRYDYFSYKDTRASTLLKDDMHMFSFDFDAKF